MKAVVCPLCNGAGRRLYANGPVSEWGTPAVCSGFTEMECHGCDGKGWVEVSDEEIKISDSKMVVDFSKEKIEISDST